MTSAAHGATLREPRAIRGRGRDDGKRVRQPLPHDQLSDLHLEERTALLSGGQLIGPLESDSAHWNNTNDDSDPLNAGSMTVAIAQSEMM